MHFNRLNIFIILFFFLLTATGSSQCDSARFVPYFDSAHKYIKIDLRKAMHYATVCLQESQKCPASPMFYESVFALCSIYDQRDLHDSAIALVVPILNDQKNNISVYYRAKLEHKLSSAYISTLKLQEGLKYSLAALKDFESIKDERNATNMLINISNIYMQQSNFKQANEMLRQAEKNARHLDKVITGNVYNTMGILYAENGKLDSAERFFLISTRVREELGDHSSIVWNYNNLGGLYVLMGETDKAIFYLEKAFKAFKDNENYIGQGAIANNLGELYAKIGNNSKALEYYRLSRSLYNISKDDDNLENLYTNLSNFYDSQGDFKTAYLYSDSLIVLKDTLHGRRLDEEIANLQTKFDFEKKNLLIANQEDELIIKEEQNQLKNIIIISISVVSLLLIFVGILFYQRYKLKQQEILKNELLHQQELRSKAIVQAEENERVRIARELHDGIGQQLSAAKLNLDALKTTVNLNTPEEGLLFKNVLELMDDSVKEVRQVSHNMMPNTLLKSGLASALREFINRISHTGSLKINLEIVGLTERLDTMTEQILYRVLQEIISNIIKHAKATEVTVQLIRSEKELTLMVEDNGVGFNVDEKLKSEESGIGLKNIQSRIEFLNGQVFFDSFTGKGTTISIEIPLHRATDTNPDSKP